MKLVSSNRPHLLYTSLNISFTQCILSLSLLCSQELEKLHDMLEETASTTATQQEIRAQRESELAALKKTLQEEISSNETSMASMRQKHSRALEDLNEQFDSMKKVDHRYL